MFLWSPAAGQQGKFDYTPTGLNQYSAIARVGAAAPVQPSYDANGNMTGDGTWAYAYDSENRMVSATRASPAKNAAYKYDPIDRRYAKTVDGVRTDYLWSGQNIVAEYAVPNTATPGTQQLMRRYVHGPGIDEPIAMLTYNGASTPGLTDIQYYHADHAGTVVAMSGVNYGDAALN